MEDFENNIEEMSEAELELEKLMDEAFEEVDEEKAIVLFTKIINLDPENSEAYNNRGLYYLRNDELDKAIADFSKVIELYPEDIEAYYTRASVYLRREETEKEALADFTKIIELSPDDAFAYCFRADFYAQNEETIWIYLYRS